MKQIACRECPKCGKFNDISVNECVCGCDVSGVPAKLVEIDNLEGVRVGKIDRNLVFYYQNCRNCGIKIYFTDIEQSTERCYNCNSASLGKPVLYAEAESVEKTAAAPAKAVEAEVVIPTVQKIPVAKPSSDNSQYSDEEVLSWIPVVDALSKAVGAKGVGNTISHDELCGLMGVSVDNNPYAEKLPEQAPKPTEKHRIVLSAVRYGNFSIAFEAVQNCSYDLGRSANAAEYLQVDDRVSHYHCTLKFADGVWQVYDNNSTNGTFVNQVDIGLNGKCALQNGDLLKLGHDADSAEFRVTIK